MKKIIVAGLLAVSPLLASTSYADDVENAYTVCSVMDGTGVLSGPCEVSGWDGAVDVSLDTNGSEARKICNGVVDMLRQNGITFSERTWKLRIYSPFSNGNTIAECALPRS